MSFKRYQKYRFLEAERKRVSRLAQKWLSGIDSVNLNFAEAPVPAGGYDRVMSPGLQELLAIGDCHPAGQQCVSPGFISGVSPRGSSAGMSFGTAASAAGEGLFNWGEGSSAGMGFATANSAGGEGELDLREGSPAGMGFATADSAGGEGELYLREGSSAGMDSGTAASAAGEGLFNWGEGSSAGMGFATADSAGGEGELNLREGKFAGVDTTRGEFVISPGLRDLLSLGGRSGEVPLNSALYDSDISYDSDDYVVLTEDETEEDVRAPVEEEKSLRQELAEYVCEEHVGSTSTKKLLNILRRHGHQDELPKTRATLVATPKDKISTKTVHPGEYYHLGIEAFFANIPVDSPLINADQMEIDVNVDGLPVFKNNKCLWPILGHLSKNKDVSPFLIGIYEGRKKPENRDDFLFDFITEANKLIANGIRVSRANILKPFRIRFFCCDSPARCFVTGAKSHGAKNGCPRCEQVGVFLGKVAYSLESSTKRTDDSVRSRSDKNHHKSAHPTGIEKITTLDVVDQVVIDPMHTLDLGVTRKIVKYIIEGKCVGFQLRKCELIQMNSFYAGLAPYIPTDFARKTRSFEDIPYWKAAEYRMFGNYTGHITIHNFLPPAFYEHFLYYFSSIRLLSMPDISEQDLQLAQYLMEYFVASYPDFYGRENVSYNVHALLHISDCVRLYGPLNEFSAYPFENFMQEFKPCIKKKHQLIPQIVKRLEEQKSIFQSKTASSTHTFSGRVPLKAPYYGMSFAYKTCQFSQFMITANQKDGCCITNTGIVISVLGFADCNEVRGVIAQRYMDVRPAYTSPIDSLKVGVGLVSHLNDHAEFFPLSDIKLKCMRLPHGEDSFSIMTLLHQSR